MLHALLQLVAEGWQWQLLRQSQQAAAPPHSKGAAQIFYSAGVEVDEFYLQALLRADELFEAGLPLLPHGRKAAEYQAILAGRQTGQMLALPPPAPQEAEHMKLQVDGCGLPEEKQVPQRTAAKATQIPSQSGPAQPKPRYFERQVGAMCGLHALNNAAGSVTGTQTFTIHTIAEALRTLRAECGRDGLPFVVTDHASPSGDYSLQLLQWMLQRHQVESSSVYFESTNLLDLHNVKEGAFQAEDLAGGLVHEPSKDGRHESAHWVAFGRGSCQELLFFWMDSCLGFEPMSLEQLRQRLANRNFATQLQPQNIFFLW